MSHPNVVLVPADIATRLIETVAERCFLQSHLCDHGLLMSERVLIRRHVVLPFDQSLFGRQFLRFQPLELLVERLLVSGQRVQLRFGCQTLGKRRPNLMPPFGHVPFSPNGGSGLRRRLPSVWLPKRS